MKRKILPILGLAALALFLPACEKNEEKESATSIALVNGTLIDGLGGTPVSDAVLVIRAGIIEAVGPRGRVPIPPGSTVIDVRGGTVLPGVINAHVHIRNNLALLKEWAKAGVTTVRDVGGPENYAEADDNNRDSYSARLVTAGPMISVPGGYPFVPWGNSNMVAVLSAEDGYQKASQLLDRGADILKIAVEHGAIFGLEIPSLTTEEVSAIVRAAHERGTSVAVHLLSAADLAQSLESDVDDIAHMVVDDLPDSLIGSMVSRDIYWEPTLELWHNVGQGFGPKAIRNLARFVRAGGKIALGTDFGGYNAAFELGIPGKEMRWMQEAGMTNMQIIVAATRNAAHVSNLDGQLGTLEPGKIADILVVKGDPLKNISALGTPFLVLRDGVIIRRED
jgi:imidazolonepropionase-like amidohydrolase